LVCAGNLAYVCGKDAFPKLALEEFTKFGLECLAGTDSKLELRESALGYFGEISKVLKSEMQPIFDTVITEIIKSIESEDGIVPQTKTKTPGDFSLDSDSDEGEELVGFDINNQFIDEKATAIHALGNISLNCSGLLYPYLEKTVKLILEFGGYVHMNIRYHVCLTIT